MKKLLLFTIFVGSLMLIPKTYAESRTFTITGYYSPLPGQSFYVTGSYEGDIRLNGNGTNGADGTEVYPGMIAAPRAYPFGTKICVPNFGCGTVHDRGGAIVEQGKRRLAKFDRLDLWMGFGEEGLRRALAWGVPSIKCEMFPVGTAINDSVNFTVPLSLNQILQIPSKPIYRENLRRGRTGTLISVLQEALSDLEFYTGEIDGIYDYDLENAVFMFQKKNFILSHKDEIGAGVFGPQTRSVLSEQIHLYKIQKKIRETWESFHFEEQISYGERSRSVLKMQEILIQQEFLDHEPTGYFGGKTKAALIQFQITHGLIANKNSAGSGKVGELTMEKLNEVLALQKKEVKTENAQILAYQKTQKRLRYLAQKDIGTFGLFAMK